MLGACTAGWTSWVPVSAKPPVPAAMIAPCSTYLWRITPSRGALTWVYSIVLFALATEADYVAVGLVAIVHGSLQ